MRRRPAALAALALFCAVAVAIPAGSGATSASNASAKSKCKKRHPHHRKRCHKKSSPVLRTDGVGGVTGPPGRLLATEREVSPSELQLQLSRPSLTPGSAIVEQYNAGSDPHNLVLERGGQIAFVYPTLDPGGDQRQTVFLRSGTWTLYCSLLDHRTLGMRATLTVN
jgi:plastocyanin